MSIKKDRSSLLGVFAFLIAVTIAFAFTPSVKPAVKNGKHPTTTIWLKYDCATGNPQIVGSGNNYQAAQYSFALCPNNSTKICSVQLNLETETEQIPGQPLGNRRPTVSILSKTKQFCAP